jgi:hypothetical protein
MHPPVDAAPDYAAADRAATLGALEAAEESGDGPFAALGMY